MAQVGSATCLALALLACGGDVTDGPETRGPSRGDATERPPAEEPADTGSVDGEPVADAADTVDAVASDDAPDGEPECAVGERECRGYGVRAVCGDDERWTEDACPEASWCLEDSGVCTAGACRPFDTRCAGFVEREECSPNATGWRETSPCGDGTSCQSGQCLPVACLPQVMFAIDGSSSMSREWSAGTIRRAVMTVAQANPDVAFGLSMFPTGLGCSIGDGSGTGIFGSGPGVDWPHVPVRADGGASLEAWLASEDGSGGATPLISTIEWFADNAELVFGPDRSNSYLVVLTEGADTCRCQDDRDRLRCLTSNLTSATERAVAAGLKVVVIGYRYSEEPEALDAIAENGGTAFTTPLLAGSEATLSDVFGEVITDLKECLQ